VKTIYHPGYRRLVGKLREARRQQGYHLKDVANKLGRNKNWLHRIETSLTRLDVLQFVRLCSILNLSSSALLAELEESSDDDSFLAISGYTGSPQKLIMEVTISLLWISIREKYFSAIFF